MEERTNPRSDSSASFANRFLVVQGLVEQLGRYLPLDGRNVSKRGMTVNTCQFRQWKPCVLSDSARFQSRTALRFGPPTSVKFVTSPLTSIERPPASSIFSNERYRRAVPSVNHDLGPLLRKDLAIAAPMPRELPVIETTSVVKNVPLLCLQGYSSVKTERSANSRAPSDQPDESKQTC